MQCPESILIRRQWIWRHDQADYWRAEIQPDHEYGAGAQVSGSRGEAVFQWYARPNMDKANR
jgi:hypothetical protein